MCRKNASTRHHISDLLIATVASDLLAVVSVGGHHRSLTSSRVHRGSALHN